MTLAFPDVSNHNGAMTLLAGTVACLAKATEGTTYVDPFYGHYKAEAARVGALFGAYHFLREGNGAAQARFAYSVIGPGVPTMIDFEPEYDDAGNPISLPSVADAVAFRDAFRALGGLVRLNYLPRWYWAGHLGSPSIAQLGDLALVASDYNAYSDNSPAWNPYGGVTPQILQYTDRQPYSGQLVDFNAFRGSLDQLRILLGLATLEADMAIADSDLNDIAARVENRPIGAIATPNPAPTTTSAGVELASLAARFGQVNAGLKDLGGKVEALAVPTVNQDDLLTAVKTALADPVILKAMAHAFAVELHNDTPAS